ncbi:MAG: class I SAM-dependent methyltransferase [Acidobacteriota bacterium]
MTEVPVELGAVQETLLIPLLGRAQETQLGGKLLNDPKAVEIVARLQYDFEKWGTSARGACIRARLFDAQVQRFLAEHPEGTVVEIGAGLNTRYERLDNGEARWLEFDLPDSMELRRRFFEEDERRTLLSASATETGWMDAVAELPGPYCFVSEAVLIYLEPPDAERTVRTLAERFSGSRLIMDITPTGAVAAQARSPLMKVMSKSSWFRWTCDDVESLREHGLRVEQTISMSSLPKDIRRDLSLPMKTLFTLMPSALIDRMSGGYAIYRFALETPST